MSCKRQMSVTWAWNTVTPWSSHSPLALISRAGEDWRREGLGRGKEGTARQR